MAEPKIKYDRQLRIWGEQGQTALEKSSICLLNCGPTGSETLKNLVLGGVGSVTVVDGSKLELGDLGNNFMVDESSVGQSKAKTVCAFLQELNDAVKAKFIEEHPEELIESTPSFFSQFTLVVATQVCRTICTLWCYCLLLEVMLLLYILLSIDFTFLLGLDMYSKENTETQVLVPVPIIAFLLYLRLSSTADQESAASMNSNMYLHVLKNIFTLSLGVLNLHSNAISFLAHQEFISNEGGGEVPLEGSIPDMTSSTELYVNLQKIYQAKAEADFLVMEQCVRKILKKIGRDPDSISKANIKSFCKNARKVKVCRYRPIEDEFNSPIQPELQKYLTDEDYCVAVGFYILLRAADRYAANYNSFPGQFDGEMDEDISRLKTTAVTLLGDLGCNGSTLTEDLINEMCRYGAAELHAVAAYVGGIASQEVIKLITRQFVPMCGTFIFNGIDHKSQLLSL
ncbi:NEDD8-activating enzyme E1 regulatory subunit AXR1-like isoform X2 [Olea europaea subsp. europaea]|uniref:NEDD8-activating enzyme E1 regulatory subunit AXR1-like isoform X2 n=1 Tax=Olea europaea subsp. europaea TaxID=158383 RepID=A0A8S0UQU2_OLEEU|nr:NEDD8-activating enzyme E1 regulatory subunit AXR1-like isoform X2 [Olea europaea subsp. europaea]